MLTQVRANAPVNLRERMEKAIAERVVSEDGIAAVSEVIGGKLAFLRGLAHSRMRRGSLSCCAAGTTTTMPVASDAPGRGAPFLQHRWSPHTRRLREFRQCHRNHLQTGPAAEGATTPAVRQAAIDAVEHGR